MNAQTRKRKDSTRREISYQMARITREIEKKTRKDDKRRKRGKNDH